MLQGEEGEVLSRFEVFNSVEVLAPGIELDELDSLLDSGESSSSSTLICIKYICLQTYTHRFVLSPGSYFWMH
jgi:hypothetical protein